MLSDPVKRRIFLRHLLHWAWSDRYRNLLSALGIVLGVAGIIVVLALVAAENRQFLRDLRLIGARTLAVRPVRGTLPPVSSRGLRGSVPEVERISRITLRRATLASASAQPLEDRPVLGVDDAFFEVLTEAAIDGRALSPADVRLANRVCLLGDGAAAALGNPRTVRIRQEPLRVVGVVSGAAADATDAEIATLLVGVGVIVPGTLGLASAARRDVDRQLLVQVWREDQVEAARERLERFFDRRMAGEVEIVSAGDLLERSRSTRGHLSATLVVFSLLALFLGGIGILNNMVALVLERLPEIGIRVALGATRRQIVLQFLSETLLITVSGCLLGAVVGLAVIGLLALTGLAAVTLSWWHLVLPPLIGTLMGVVFGAYPAMRAADQKPIEAFTFR